MKTAPHRLSAEFTVGGQEHFYLEGQIAFALPGEDGDIVVHTSTQHPTEVQHICARVLGCDFARVTAVVRRLGGGFGGKESNASWVAGAAAVAANHTGKPVKLRLPREVDMIATGKRHPFLCRYTVGFDGEGRPWNGRDIEVRENPIGLFRERRTMITDQVEDRASDPLMVRAFGVTDEFFEGDHAHRSLG